uniref:uncharacterized protein LOC112430683 n=1 Tax=Maylandia zebra TaxID=106582 RepID=UPI000D31F629|nr:uncharacterized protein LOC112430683 [Maylandia zebra]
MASVSPPRRKNLSAQQALALLQEMDEADSDGGEVSFVQQATDTSSEESEKETEQEPNMPPRKRPCGSGKPSQSHTAKDGTVWVEEDIGKPSAYIATKPDKFGIKFWMATDLDTKYVCSASPYLGKDPSRQKGQRLAENMVMKLMEPFWDDGRNVTTDNFFTSLSLSHRLLQHKTTLLGTVNKVQRELPQLAKDTAKREVFSTSVLRSGGVSLTIYAPKKTKTVCVLSSMHQDVMIGDGRKRKPNTITDYNHMKCGVDVLDQMAWMYSVRAATRRWPVAVFYNMLDLAAVNAYILYKVRQLVEDRGISMACTEPGESPR